jgi:uncharacterized protein
LYNKMCDGELPTGRQIAWFVAATFALGTIAQLLAIRIGLEGRGQMWLLLAMWAPGISALCTGVPSRRLAWAALKELGWRFLGLGLFLGFAPTIVKTLLLAISSSGHWDSQHFELSPDGHSINSIRHLMVLGSGPQSFARFGLNLALSMSVWAIIVALFAVGEELGWRGVLQPSMEARYGRVVGTLCVGLMWGYWHVPLNLMGYNDSSHPLLNAVVLFPITLVAISFVLAWLRRRSRSVWPAALAHGAHNTISPAFLIMANSWGTDSMADLAGTLLVAALLIVGAARVRSRPLPTLDSSAVALRKA